MHAILALLVMFGLSPGLLAMQKEDQAAGRPSVPGYWTTPIVIEVIRLRFAGTSDVASHLGVPKPAKQPDAPAPPQANTTWPVGIQRIFCDDRTNSLVITGTPDAIALLKPKIHALDVPIRSVRIQMNVLRFDFDKDGSWNMRIVSAPTIWTIDNITASFSMQGNADASSVDITPHLNPSGSISLEGEIRAMREHAAFRRELPAKTSMILGGVTDAQSAAIRKAVASGYMPTAMGEPFTIFYLQLVSVQEDKRR